MLSFSIYRHYLNIAQVCYLALITRRPYANVTGHSVFFFSSARIARKHLLVNNHMAKFFNIMAEKSVKPPIRRLDVFLRRIHDPVSYQLGLKKPELDLPDNILMFVRRQGVVMHPPRTNPVRYILILNLRGMGDVILDGRRIHLFAHHTLLIFPGQLHYYENLNPRRMTWFYISFMTANPKPLTPLRNWPIPLSAQAWHYSEDLARDYVDPERTSFHLVSRITVTLYLLLMELVKARRSQEPAIPIPREPNLRRVDELRRHIEQHMGTSLCLPDLARHMNMSLSTLKDFSRRNLSMGLARYVRLMRIHFARGLMSTTNLTMTEIADQCGFSSIYTFSRAFKRIMKISPTAYRARLYAVSRRRR